MHRSPDTTREAVRRGLLRPYALALLLLAAAALPAQPPAAGDQAEAIAHPDTPSRTEPTADPSDCWSRWRTGRERLVDLLLDGDFVTAQAQADAILALPDLPADLAHRVTELRMRATGALGRRAADALAASTPRADPATAADPPPSAPVTHAAAPVPTPARAAVTEPPALDVTFRVRSTRPGRGFRNGADGRLRISSQGIGFVPDDRSEGDAWTVTWGELASAGEADGTWDVSHPLALTTEDGTRYFLAEMGRDGRFGSGERVLTYIEKGRRRYREGAG